MKRLTSVSSSGARSVFARAAIVALLCTVVSRPAAAEWPPAEGADLSDSANWPSDPGYAGQWNLWSFMPSENDARVTDYERSIGSGLHADRAWQLTTGDRRVVIAVVDSGIRWRERDLVNKYFINRGELPVPEAACGAAPGADPYDANGDGYFNVQDYTTATGHDQPTADRICDSRVTDVNGNGILDPQDLIKVFSDGSDDDNNGWVDDISGWDIYRDDNDPNDDTDFGHGTGEAKDSASETDNGISEAGVCPECMLLMVRIGDSFVVESNDFALGTIFAIDSGAAVIQDAVGAISNGPLARQAIEYAWKQNVSVVASAADEDSFHANLPGSVNHTLYVHANTYNKTSREASDTFLAYNNCTNYGSQLLLSVPGTGCSSEATGKTAGIVGLIYAAGLQTGLSAPPTEFDDTDKFSARVLSGEEIKQLLLTGVDDIYDPNDATDPTKYETFPGWDMRFGYGRVNSRNAVEAVMDQRIPPVVDIWGPDWFKVIYPDRTGTVDITGNISFRRNLFDSYDYVVEWARGIEPLPTDWTTLAEGTGETEFIEGTLAQWDISSLNIDNPPLPEPDLAVTRYMVTVRVRVVLNSSDSARNGTMGEIRRAFHIHRDPSLRSGFPIALDGGGESSPKITDIDGDGTMELVYVSGGGTIYVVDGNGTARPGWPQKLPVILPLRESNANNHRQTAGAQSGAVSADTHAFALYGPAVGDLDGDGPDGRSIVIATFEGEVFAYAADGTMRPGFPVTLDRRKIDITNADWTLDSGVFAAPVLGDLDGDGDLEIIVAALDAHLYVWQHDGTMMSGWPVLLSDGDKRARIVETPAIGDIDGDGALEIVVGTNEDYDGRGRVYALNADGTLLPSWPRNVTSVSVLPFVGTGLPNSPVIADFDKDGIVDVAIAGVISLPTLIRGDGTLIGILANGSYGELTNTDDIPSFVSIANGSAGDLDNDGIVDVIWGGAGLGFAEAFASSGSRVDIDHHVGAWNSKTLQYLPGFPRRADDHQFFMNPAVADVDDDGRPEVISGSGGYYLRAWNSDGDEPSAWPKFSGGWIIASPAVGDLDGDGTLEVAVATREGFLFVWDTEGKIDGRIDWASFHHDDHNTGNLESPIGFGVGARPGGDAGGCGCRITSSSSSSIALLFLSFVVVVGRRRRRRR